MEKRQIVYMKSRAGFADRLRCLSHCVLYCVKHNALLCIDWKDDTWGMEFEELFDFFGPTISKKEVWKKVKDGAEVYPPCWTLKEIVLPLAEDALDANHIGLTDASYTDLFFKLPGDVIMTNGLGTFRYNIEYISNYMRVKPDVVKEILPKLEVLKNPSIMIHLRGTDRTKNDAYDKMEREFRSYVKHIPDVPVYVISDSPDLVLEWFKLFPKCKLFRPDASVFKMNPNVHGSHTYSERELKRLGITKRQYNIETLIDFFALASAMGAFGRKESYYFETARDIGRRKLINNFLFNATCTHPSQSTLSELPSSPSASEQGGEQNQPCAPGPHQAHAHPQTECPAPSAHP